MQLRPATIADLPAIAALHAGNWRRDYAGLLPEGALGAPLDALMARLWSASSGILDKTLILEGRQGGVIGFATHDRRGAEGLYLSSLHVAAHARGVGAGRALIAAVADLAGDDPLWLEVLCGNHPTRAIYRNWGGIEGPAFADEMLGALVQSCRVTWPAGKALCARLRAEPCP
ncbi:GNAT family N-acetyltransferase [Roseicyclus sp.]|uniref:GNAT family N-acetyltransferase n=1 Tax=Roseicyclus sp. TaxID=1914329 RepID=UPI003F6AF3BF